ncbi:cytochrome c maturation protein CcmE [Niabella beijingensis]|uniref:cytochrome c maturation protein CcmE domain-containing protein n=1 Tax=Niabella beijingensis TaxID=2872700 RepID=UPI001CBDAF2A|nr:cytochrome c maturation protein CcmE [Niabella beijingensis]MBZ4192361.1 cytochrome c maturation protein CcmE [Niabella beijingensis]
MKKIHIILLVLVAAAIAVLVSFLQTTTTYDTVETAKSKPGKFVHLMAKWDKSAPLEYDAVKNPNYLAFTAVDSLGQKINVIYHNPKPENFELSERLVMKGKYNGTVFECQSIQTKCPSKYKDQDPSKHVPQEDRKTTYNNIRPAAIADKQ